MLTYSVLDKMGLEGIQIVSLGAATPVGRNALASAAAVRAGISGLAKHPYMIDSIGQPMRVARAPWLDHEMTWEDRVTSLLFSAIDEVLGNVRSFPDLRIGLAVAIPASRPGLPASYYEKLPGIISRRYAKIFAAAAFFPAGHAAGSLALEASARKLLQGGVDACLVAGADSYLEPETLEWLEDTDQLHGAGRLNNAWGFIPGEAAGSLCLMRAETASQLGIRPVADVLAATSAHEPKRIRTETVCLGEGLTQAFRGVLHALPAGCKVSDVYCDLNGEPYRADEYGFASLRMQNLFESASDFVAPADCCGDVAAASIPLFLSLAAIAVHKGYAKGSFSLAWAGSDEGERGAVLICRPGYN
jgi:3-oxoacyl-[acyl-carrier-protein] synthase I